MNPPNFTTDKPLNESSKSHYVQRQNTNNFVNVLKGQKNLQRVLSLSWRDSAIKFLLVSKTASEMHVAPQIKTLCTSVFLSVFISFHL